MEWILFILRSLAVLIMALFLGLCIYRAYRMDKRVQALSVFLNRLDEPISSVALLPKTSLGRDQQNTIIIDDDFVSAQHALISYKDDDWWLLDLNSTNGTWLNGVVIEEPQKLKPGDEVRLGQAHFYLEHRGNS